MVGQMDWYQEQQDHTFDEVDAAAEAEAEAILEEDRLLHRLEQDAQHGTPYRTEEN